MFNPLKNLRDMKDINVYFLPDRNITFTMSEPQLVGMAKHFNSATFTGRANVAKATYAGIITIET